MAHKHKTVEADRSTGGPGSSHENADKQEKRRDPGGQHGSPAPGEPTNTSRSGTSGGGGERDRHHTHDPMTKS